MGNSFAIETSEGNVIFDTGLIIQASEQIAKPKAAVGDEEPKKIILSHSHADHVGGTRLWDEGNAEIVAHEEFEEERATSPSSTLIFINVTEPSFHGSLKRHARSPVWTSEVLFPTFAWVTASPTVSLWVETIRSLWNTRRRGRG